MCLKMVWMSDKSLLCCTSCMIGQLHAEWLGDVSCYGTSMVGIGSRNRTRLSREHNQTAAATRDIIARLKLLLIS